MDEQRLTTESDIYGEEIVNKSRGILKYKFMGMTERRKEFDGLRFILAIW